MNLTILATALMTVAIPSLFFASSVAEGQALSVLPVNILLSPGQKAASLTITNQSQITTSVQIRGFSWSQDDGEDHIKPTDALMVSPPITSIAPGASQVVRIILRTSPQAQEATYRILLDEIPPPAEAGQIRVALRLSIPIFVEPDTRASARIRFELKRTGDQLTLVGWNDGLRHEAIRDIVLTTADGQSLRPAQNVLPYILAGASRRWTINTQGPLPLPSQALQLNAHGDSGTIQQQLNVETAP